MDREIAPQKDRVSLSKACSEDVAELGFKQRPAEPPVCGETPPSCTHTHTHTQPARVLAKVS